MVVEMVEIHQLTMVQLVLLILVVAVEVEVKVHLLVVLEDLE